MGSRTQIALFAMVSLGVLAAPARAEISDQDRQARCANNTQAIETAESNLKSIPGRMSDEEIARARTDLEFVRRYNSYGKSNSRNDDTYFGIVTRYGLSNSNGDHADETIEVIGKRIDAALRARPEVERLSAFIAARRARMIELQCTGHEPRKGVSGWQAAGSGDCPGRDEGSSSGLLPDPGMCTAERAGRVAVCWDGKRFRNHYGETNGAPSYPWCTYKSTGSCGGGENTGTLYYCHP